MSLLDFFISPAAAAATPASAAGPNMMAQLLLLGGFVVIFWLLIWRPQSKRTKAHKELLNNISKGDEVVTNGGIMGKVTHVGEQVLTLSVAESVELNFQKSSIVAALPKGTLKAIK